MVQFIDANLEELDGGRIIKYRLFTGDLPMSYLHFIGQLSSKEPFRQEFNTLLASSGFSAFRFETPVLCSATIDDPFEFVLIDAPTRQIDALWEMVGTALQNHTGTLWFNTEGSGVAWLHIRLDTRPKYYGYTPYKASVLSSRKSFL